MESGVCFNTRQYGAAQISNRVTRFDTQVQR